MMTEQNESCVVELRGVTKVYGSRNHGTFAVRDISLSVYRGDLLLLLGPSGSGKTTLLTLIAGLLKPTSGCIRLFGRPIEEYSAQELQKIRAARMGFVFQTFLLIDSLTVLENVALVLQFAGKARSAALKQAERFLKQFHIEHLAARFPPQLSQGEKQRAAVARAIANDAEIILADEPTGSLEAKQGFEIIRLLQEYATEQHRCVIVASHDLRIVEFAERVLHLQDGILVDDENDVIVASSGDQESCRKFLDIFR